jgi:hypothetical protein
VIQTTVAFTVTYVPSPVQVAVKLSDEDGNQAGNVTVTISSIGKIAVSLRDVLASILAQYPQSFTIRAIRGNILKVSLEIVTNDVPINIDPVVTTTVEYSTQVTPTPTVTPTSTLAPLTPLSNSLSTGAIVGIVIGSVAGAALVLLAIAVVVVIVIVGSLKHKKKVRLHEQRQVNAMF